MSAHAISTSLLDRHSFVLDPPQNESQHRAGEAGSEKEWLKLFLGITDTLVSNLELRDLLRAISASIQQIMHCDVVGVWLPDLEPAVPQHCREPGRQSSLDHAKEPGTMQIFNTKPPFRCVARTHRQNQEEGSAVVVIKSQFAQIARASAEPDAEISFEQSLSRITSVDWKEIHRLARFLPVIVLVPRSTAADQVAPHKISAAKSSSECSERTELLGVLGKALERFKSTSGASTVAFGDVTINFSAMEALRKGQPVVLTTREFKTLGYFIQNARRVISRDELLNEVWGYENYPCTRTVDNHILRLRKKLELDPSRPVHFRTVHGAGYKFLP
jgi:DNA-binding response OmpR family regulator